MKHIKTQINSEVALEKGKYGGVILVSQILDLAMDQASDKTYQKLAVKPLEQYFLYSKL